MFWLTLALADPQQTAVAEWRRDPALFDEADRDLPWIRAVGRMRSPEALPLLKPLLAGEHHEDVLFALGLTPGTEDLLRAELLRADRDHREGDAAWLCIEGLGRQGGARAVPQIARELESAWPYNEAAARALLRMHRHNVQVDSALPLLAVQPSDPRAEVSFAQALARIAPGTPIHDWRHGMTTAARAGWFRVSNEHLQWALWDQPEVQVEALLHIAEKPVKELASVVNDRLSHPHAGVREAAIGAAGALGQTEALEARLLDNDDSHEVALLHQALKRGLPPAGETPPLLGAVWIGKQTDVDVLRAHLGAEHPPIVRSAAASTLLELHDDRDTILSLLEVPDAAVREAALEAISGPPDKALVEEIVFALRVENDVSVMATGLDLLLRWSEQRRSHVPQSRFLTSLLKRAMGSRSARVRTVAIGLSARLGLDLLPPPPSADERELILPDGTVTRTVGDLPDLAQVNRIREAIVTTTKGSFTIALDPGIAPLAVHNFASLAVGHFYDETRWHRVIPGFVAQGGCPRGDGWGGPGWMIVDEVSDRPFLTGAVGMARSARDTGGSQFFVMTGPARFLEGDYTWFGSVTSGMQVVQDLTADDRILTVEVLREP